MTSDLKLGGSSNLTLTSDTSNVPDTGFTLLAENTGTWCSTNNSACDDQSLMIKTGVPNGYLYNWYAATAGTGTYSTSSGSTTYNICPKGWTLPTGGSSGQFRDLAIAYGGSGSNETNATAVNNLMTSPAPGFNYTGRRGGSTVSTTSDGVHWSRTALNNNSAYYLSFNSSGRLVPQNYGSKYYGFAIRCVATQ